MKLTVIKSKQIPAFTIDGGFDFNSTWNFEFRNQAGRSSLAKESAIPPENFKMFFKEQVTSFTEDNKFSGNLKITIGENNYDLKVPFSDVTHRIGRGNLQCLGFNGRLLSEVRRYL